MKETVISFIIQYCVQKREDPLGKFEVLNFRILNISVWGDHRGNVYRHFNHTVLFLTILRKFHFFWAYFSISTHLHLTIILCQIKHLSLSCVKYRMLYNNLINGIQKSRFHSPNLFLVQFSHCFHFDINLHEQQFPYSCCKSHSHLDLPRDWWCTEQCWHTSKVLFVLFCSQVNDLFCLSLLYPINSVNASLTSPMIFLIC